NRVLIMDTDNQGNSYLSFGGNPDELDDSMYDVLMGTADFENAKVKISDYLDVLPSNDAMEFFDLDVLTNIQKYPYPFLFLKEVLKNIRDEYDYIIVDTPPNLGLIQGNVLTAVDEVIIPFQPEVYSMRSLVKMLDVIESFREKHNKDLKVNGVVATLVDMRTNLHKDILEQAREYCKERHVRMFETVIPKTIRFASNIAYNSSPLEEEKKEGKLAKRRRKQKEKAQDEFHNYYRNLLGEMLT